MIRDDPIDSREGQVFTRCGISFGTQERKPWVVIVDRFLGSGKTGLILSAARLLQQRGLRCAAILNDQSEELVDTLHATRQGVLSREVTGGCFCCKFPGLMAVVDELRSLSPDVIFAEPVGSCTDISATVFGPFMAGFDHYRVAPFTVLADPAHGPVCSASLPCGKAYQFIADPVTMREWAVQT